MNEKQNPVALWTKRDGENIKVWDRAEGILNHELYYEILGTFDEILYREEVINVTLVNVEPWVPNSKLTEYFTAEAFRQQHIRFLSPTDKYFKSINLDSRLAKMIVLIFLRSLWTGSVDEYDYFVSWFTDDNTINQTILLDQIGICESVVIQRTNCL